MISNDLVRFNSHITVDPLSGCHNWTGARNAKGYGHFSIPRTPAERRVCPRGGYKRVLAHRWLYCNVFGCIPAELEVDHKCCNPACCNPDHLQAITKAKNLELRGKVHL